jgi:anaerobic selenocysteine-containing dehydrogenase
LRVCGLPREQLERVAAVYMRARAVIVVYGMGITQHRLGTAKRAANSESVAAAR